MALSAGVPRESAVAPDAAGGRSGQPPDPSCPSSDCWSGRGAAGQDRPGREEGTVMIDKMVSGAVNALTGAIKVVVLFGVLVGLVVWARQDPESWKAVMAQVAGVGVALVSWVCDLIVSVLNQGG
jgi:hypothetical protein